MTAPRMMALAILALAACGRDAQPAHESKAEAIDEPAAPVRVRVPFVTARAKPAVSVTG